MNFIKRCLEELIETYGTCCPYELADHLCFEVYEFPFPNQHGMIFSVGGSTIMGVRAGLPVYAKRAVVAHEIAHKLLHPDSVGYFMEEMDIFAPGKLELEANQFAGALLLREETPEYGETFKEFAARVEVPLKLVHIHYGL